MHILNEETVLLILMLCGENIMSRTHVIFKPKLIHPCNLYFKKKTGIPGDDNNVRI